VLRAKTVAKAPQATASSHFRLETVPQCPK
jgi:hypothetical protein